MELCAAFPQHRRLFALAFRQQRHFAAHPLLLCTLADRLLQLHQSPLACFNRPLLKLLVERKVPNPLHRIVEDAEPVELRLADKLLQNLKSRSDSPGKPTMKDVRRAMPGTAARTFSKVFRKISAPAPASSLQNVGEACCSGTSRYLQMLSCFAIVFEQPPVRRFG